MNLRLTWIIYGAPVYKQNLLNVLYFCPLTNFTCSSRLHHLRLIFRLRTILTVIKIIFLNPVYLELLNSRSDTKPSESRNPFPPWSLPPWKGPFCHGMKDEYGHTGVDDSHWAPTCHSAKVSSPLACSVFVFIISSRRYFVFLQLCLDTQTQASGKWIPSLLISGLWSFRLHWDPLTGAQETRQSSHLHTSASQTAVTIAMHFCTWLVRIMGAGNQNKMKIRALWQWGVQHTTHTNKWPSVRK